MTNTEEEKVRQLLCNIQLDQFYRQIQDKLHVSRLSHFDHVREDDLHDLGMAKPERRRLFEALKKAKKKNLFASFRRKKTKKVSEEEKNVPARPSSQYGVAGDSLTCVINEKSLALYELLGNGAFGYVRKGEWTKEPNKKMDVAVKCLKYSGDEELLKMQIDFIKEANAMSLLDHPHIIRLYGVVLSTPLMLVTELAPLGCLLSRLRDEPHNFSLSTLCDYATQIASGMAYLESHRFIHMDIAARNLLLESYEKVKIGDFGMMHVLSGDEEYYTVHPTGKVPFAWCPPESLKFRQFSHASDVWAFGIMVTELFSYGGEPWPGLNGAEILEKVDLPKSERPTRPDHCPTAIYKVLTEQCWAHDARHRPRFNALKKTLEEVRPVNARAIFPYDSRCSQNLSFQEGDTITVLEASAEDSWWRGQNMRTGNLGLFPAELVNHSKTVGSPSKRLFGSPSFKKQVKQRCTSASGKQSTSGKQSNCECGSQHIYEVPVIFPSFGAEDSGSHSSLSPSCESDLTSSSEYDSGYSSIDTCASTRKFSSHSADERKSSKSSFSSHTESLYEQMNPVECASSPIPIPHQNGRQPYDTTRARCNATPSLRRDSVKCPLDLCGKSSPVESVASRVNGSPPLPPSRTASTPSSSLNPRTSNSKPSRTASVPSSCSSLSASGTKDYPLKTRSFPNGKNPPVPSGLGDNFTQEMLSFLGAASPESVDVNCETSKTNEQTSDVYEDMTIMRSVSCGSQDSNFKGSGESTNGTTPPPSTGLKLSGKTVAASLQGASEVYEDMTLVRLDCTSHAKLSSSTKQRQLEREHLYENHSFGQKEDKGVIERSASCYENVAPAKKSEQGETPRRNSTQPVYDNHKLRTKGEFSKSWGSYDNHKLGQTDRSPTQLPPNYDNWKLKEPVVYERHELRTCAASSETPKTPRPQSYENCEVSKVGRPLETAKTSNGTTDATLNYENVDVIKARSSLPTEDVCEGPVTEPACEAEGRSALYENCSPGSVPIPGDGRKRGACALSRDHWPHSLPENLRCVDVLPGNSDASLILMLNKGSAPLRNGCAGSTGNVSTDAGSQEPEPHPIPPPRRKRMSRMSRQGRPWSVEVTGELAHALTKKLSIGKESVPRRQTGDFIKELGVTQVPSLPTRTNQRNSSQGNGYSRHDLSGRRALLSAYENVVVNCAGQAGSDSIPVKDRVVARVPGLLMNGLKTNGISVLQEVPPQVPPKVGRPVGASHRSNSLSLTAQSHQLSVDPDFSPMSRSYSDGERPRGGGVHQEPLYVNSSKIWDGPFVDRKKASTVDSDVPPPLPEKTRHSRGKSRPTVPPRPDLQETS